MIKLLWTLVIVGLVLALCVAFGLSLLLLKELLRVTLDPTSSWPYWWHPWVGYPVAMLFLGGSGWLLSIAFRVIVTLIRNMRKPVSLE